MTRLFLALSAAAFWFFVTLGLAWLSYRVADRLRARRRNRAMWRRIQAVRGRNV